MVLTVPNVEDLLGVVVQSGTAGTDADEVRASFVTSDVVNDVVLVAVVLLPVADVGVEVRVVPDLSGTAAVGTSNPVELCALWNAVTDLSLIHI